MNGRAETMNERTSFSLVCLFRPLSLSPPPLSLPSPPLPHLLYPSSSLPFPHLPFHPILFPSVPFHPPPRYFNLTSNAWLEKETHVHARYVEPESGKASDCEETGGCCVDGGNVFSEVTRRALLDNNFGRTNKTIFIKEPRNQAPGWDGCRDRDDGLVEPFPQELLWEKPLQISMHKALYSSHYDILLT